MLPHSDGRRRVIIQMLERAEQKQRVLRVFLQQPMELARLKLQPIFKVDGDGPGFQSRRDFAQISHRQSIDMRKHQAGLDLRHAHGCASSDLPLDDHEAHERRLITLTSESCIADLEPNRITARKGDCCSGKRRGAEPTAEEERDFEHAVCDHHVQLGKRPLGTFFLPLAGGWGSAANRPWGIAPVAVTAWEGNRP